MPNSNNSLITRPVLIIALAIGIFLCLLALFFQFFIFPNIIIKDSESIIVNITPFSDSSSMQTLDSRSGNHTNLTEMTSIPGVIALGMEIEVIGTGNEGLRIHQKAGIDQPTLSLAQEGEKFKIIDGPVVLDSLIWWKIESTNNPAITGWSVQDYMKPGK